MTEKGMDAGDGATLWYRVRGSWRESVGAPQEPDALTLAAYLDGTLDETEAAAVETWMAASREALDSVLAARAALAEAPLAGPDHVVARAQAIVHARRPSAAAGTGRRPGLFGSLAEALRPGLWAGAAAALLIACVSGFELGRLGVEHLASLDAAVAADVRLVMGRTGQDLL